MAKHNNKGRARHGPPEHWTKLLRATMDTEAWRALSPTAQALYPWLKLEWKGPDANNNGKLSLSVRQVAACMGITSHTAARAFHDLQAKGFIVQTGAACLGTSGAAKAPSYEITELAMPHTNQREGRKLFREWRQGHDFPVQRAAPNNPAGWNGKTETRVENEHGPVLKMSTKASGPSSKSTQAVSKMSTKSASDGPSLCSKLAHPYPTIRGGLGSRTKCADQRARAEYGGHWSSEEAGRYLGEVRSSLNEGSDVALLVAEARALQQIAGAEDLPATLRTTAEHLLGMIAAAA